MIQDIAQLLTPRIELTVGGMESTKQLAWWTGTAVTMIRTMVIRPNIVFMPQVIFCISYAALYPGAFFFTRFRIERGLGNELTKCT